MRLLPLNPAVKKFVIKMHKVFTSEFWCDLLQYVVIAENCLKLKYSKFLPLNSDLKCHSSEL